ncbi:uncharacterized protein BDW43DRAFT_307426 [Aspergillus alliaceus]|uniref:uncharacterized protein n=1 Tax=Petromyces alliaceus TaxID=209559 RepID=UPI0012A53982|nr:uncharacterized protein BDW43DRAFT_307426 [Aspergillus alliaceus]KAB8237145.1 hypothetical protein BDW43DRAFT_307426 [Aspergillus alliaceus]
MLAADMGVADIPTEHPDAGNFLPRHVTPDQTRHLIICGGQVLGTHERVPYHESREARRLIVSQLSLGLEHLKPGGSIIVLLHKVEAWDTVQLLYTVNKSSSIQLFKPLTSHTKRSSFYMVTRNVGSHHLEAILAIARWKDAWYLVPCHIRNREYVLENNL